MYIIPTQALGHFLVSRDSKIHKMRNIAFGITQTHFFGVLYLYLSDIIKKHVQNMTFSKFFWFLGHFFTHPGPRGGWGCGGSHKFSTGPKLSEYVHVVNRNTNGTCLKSVPKTPTFRFFSDFGHFSVFWSFF